MIRARGGDDEAFGQLCTAHWARLVAMARVVLTDDTEAEDAVQDCLVHSWQKLPSLRDPRAFSAWLRKITLRECIRRAKRHIRHVEAFDEDCAQPPNQSTHNVAQALRELSPRQRAVVFLGDVQGQDDAAIARLLGVSSSTVRVHRKRARDRLSILLGEVS